MFLVTLDMVFCLKARQFIIPQVQIIPCIIEQVN